VQASTIWHVRSLPPFSGAYIGGLGLSGSGKSTLVRGMTVTQPASFSNDARMAYRQAIYSNLLESARAVAAALRKFQVELADPSNVVSSSSELDTLVSSFNTILHSTRWNSCCKTVSMWSHNRRRVHLPLFSQAHLLRPYIASGKTKRCPIS